MLIGLEFILFAIVSVAIVLSAIGVIVFANPIHSTLSLIVTLLGVAAVFAMLNAHFLAVVQIIIYAGAIVVLVLFVVMLLNSKPEVFKKSLWFRGTIAALTGGLLTGLIAGPVLYVSDVSLSRPSEVEGTVKALGELLFTKYLLPFEVASFLIMTALVGAVMLAGNSKKLAGKNQQTNQNQQGEL